MTTKDEALRLAREALESLFNFKYDPERRNRCLKALAAIEQAEKDAPLDKLVQVQEDLGLYPDQAVKPPFECWSADEGDSWYEHPADAQIIYDLLGDEPKVGDEFEITAGWYNVTARYRVTEVGADGDCEVECISHPTDKAAPTQPQEQAWEAVVEKDERKNDAGLDIYSNTPKSEQQRQLAGTMALGQSLDGGADKEEGDSQAQGTQPVATVVEVDEYGPILKWTTHWVELMGAKLYTNPPAREWVGLTDEDLRKLADKHLFYQTEGYEDSGVFDLARDIEAKLREKNAGKPAAEDTRKQDRWDDVPQDFRDWWNGDYDDSTNPFRLNSSAYWAWAGWKAADDKAGGDEPVATGTWEHLKLMMEESAWDGKIELADALANIVDFEKYYTRPQPQAVPDGYALVPLEPTLEMLDAADADAYRGVSEWARSEGAEMRRDWSFYDCYRAMLNAAPKPQGAEP